MHESPLRTADRVSPRAARTVAIIAWIGAVVGSIGGQLHALARVAAHPEDLESPLVAAWTVPVGDALAALLTWAEPTFVYWTYGKIWLPVCLAFLAAAVLAYRVRRPERAERVLWRVQLGAYGLLALAVAGDYYTPWTDTFFLVGLAAFAIIGIGGAVLGVVLLRRGFRPRTTAVLLLVMIPFFFVITEITSMGSAMLPLMWGWALAAQSIASRAAREAMDIAPSISLRATPA